MAKRAWSVQATGKVDVNDEVTSVIMNIEVSGEDLDFPNACAKSAVVFDAIADVTNVEFERVVELELDEDDENGG